MKFFLILFGLATIFLGLLIILYSVTYEAGISSLLKGLLGLILAASGLYLIIQGAKEFRKS
jgi:hypothetical protein